MTNSIFSANDLFIKIFGQKVYKLSLKGSDSCPHKASGGCIFCLNGSGDFTPQGESIEEEIESAKAFINKKYNNGKYIAYFQSNTATYAPIEKMKERFLGAAKHPEIIALDIATRPDCLGEEILQLLKELSLIKPLFVELGLQTSNQDTADFINRGYKNSAYVHAVKQLHKIGANVITHIILGLPYESKEDMLNSVKFAVQNSTDGIKLQLLHILKGTALAQMYLKEPFHILEKEEYIDILLDCIKIIPKDIAIHRLTGDGNKKALIAPLYSADKKRMINDINKAILDNNIIQGSSI